MTIFEWAEKISDQEITGKISVMCWGWFTQSQNGWRQRMPKMCTPLHAGHYPRLICYWLCIHTVDTHTHTHTSPIKGQHLPRQAGFTLLVMINHSTCFPMMLSAASTHCPQRSIKGLAPECRNLLTRRGPWSPHRPRLSWLSWPLDLVLVRWRTDCCCFWPWQWVMERGPTPRSAAVFFSCSPERDGNTIRANKSRP